MRLGQFDLSSGFRFSVRKTQSGTKTSAIANDASKAVTTGNAKRIIKNLICPSTNNAGKKR